MTDDDCDPPSPAELRHFRWKDEMDARRAAEKDRDELVLDLLDQLGGLSTDQLTEWLSARDEEDQGRVLSRMFRANPSVAGRMLFPNERDVGRRTEAAIELGRMIARQHAKDAFDLMQRDGSVRPELVNLSAFLDEPDEDVRYRVEGLWPRDGRVLLAAQFKAGKTTLVGNLLRSLVDGDDFLGTFTVERADRVVLLDDELAPGMVRRWLRDQAIRKTDAIDLVSLRGSLSSFDILNPTIRSEWAERIGPADVLVLDCLRPALDALGLSEDKEAGRFLTALDELVREAGVSELLLVHHMGHSNERSRGDSRLLDWPDAIWKLVREDGDDSDVPLARFFSAVGRDVEQPEVRLAFDPDDRHLSINGPSRSRARAGDLEVAVRECVRQNPGCSQNAIEDKVEGKTNYVRQAVANLVRDGWIRIEKQGRTHHHYEVDGGAAAEFSENP
ncbi:AAA family ATPase [Nocardioides halotolerans]|uniref:AAA family ATPase n=1 Tax=Nocardioides halotolerans TaxID=433660 RepID=UPI00048E65CE|nr:AAA family ATPase [Nocardioides halotolerans]